MKIWKQILILLILLFTSYLLANPVARLYAQYYKMPGGLFAFLAGFFVCLLFFSGLIFGLFKNWFKSLLIILAIPIIYFFISTFKDFSQETVVLLVILLAGFILGFAIRKIYQASRNYMISEVQKSERKY